MKTPGLKERVFTLCIDDLPVAVFLAKGYAEARELVRESWLREELASLTLRGEPLCATGATLSVRSADEAEVRAYDENLPARPSGEDLVLVYMVPLGES